MSRIGKQCEGIRGASAGAVAAKVKLYGECLGAKVDNAEVLALHPVYQR